jgi:hypothetical protein
VIGLTAGAEQRKKSSSGARESKQQWNEAMFFTALQESQRGNDAATAARKILEWAVGQQLRISWGSGTGNASFIPILDQGGLKYSVIAVSTRGSIELRFKMLKSRPPFDDEARRLELLTRFNSIPGISLLPDAIDGNLNISLAVLEDEAAMAQFLDALTWAFDQIRVADVV